VIAANTVLLIVTRYSLLPINIATGILIARILGPAALGLYTLMLWLPSVLAGPMSLGLGNANLFFAARDRTLTRALAANSVAVSVFASVFILGMVYLVINAAPEVLPTGLGIWQIMVPLADLPFRMFNMYGANIFNALKQHKTYRRCEVVQTFTYAMGAFAAVFLFDMTLWGFVLSQIFASVATTLYTLSMLVRSGDFGLRPDFVLLKQGVIYGGKIQVGSILRVAGQKIDELLVVRFSGVGPLGILTLGRNVTNRIRVIPMSLGTVIVPELAQGGDTSRDLVASAARRLVVLMCTIVIAGVSLAPILVPLVYGDAFQAAVGPLQILLLVLIPLSVQRMLVMYFVATGNAGMFVRIAVVGLTATLLLDLALIPIIGVYGAVIASLLGVTAEMIYSLRVFAKLTSASWTDILLPHRADAAALWQYAVSFLSAKGTTRV
jgi:O-antigen/teichoic acid export membrane protein